MGHLSVVVLVVHRGEDVLLLLVVNARKDQEQHTLQVVAELRLRASFLQPREIGFTPNAVLSHALLGLSPHRWAVEVLQEELVHSDRCFLCYRLLQGPEKELHAILCGLAFGCGCPKFAVIQFPHRLICGGAELGSKVQRGCCLQRLLALTAKVEIPGPLHILFKQLSLPRILGYSIPVTIQPRGARSHRGARSCRAPRSRSSRPADAGQCKGDATVGTTSEVAAPPRDCSHATASKT